MPNKTANETAQIARTVPSSDFLSSFNPLRANMSVAFGCGLAFSWFGRL